VRECLRERKRLLQAAPDLVTLQPFYIPIYSSSKRGNTTIATGLSLYQLLGGGTFRFLNRQQRAALPINKPNLTGLWQYWDCQTHDAALTQRVVSAAQKLGCNLQLDTYAKAIEILAPHAFHLSLNNGTEVHSRCLINAAGPWVNEVAALNTQLPQLNIQWVQGSHLVIDRPALNGCYYLESPIDGRPFFVLPWQGKQLIGTTETPINNPSTAAITPAERDYLITSYQHFFSGPALTPADIITTFCGVRVLPASTSAPQLINRAKRDTQFVQTPDTPGYLALYGGKLTSFYATALKGLQLLAPVLTEANRHLTFTSTTITQPKF
ncbi:MAG TPA: FAD-dependent oxidoreductase, partial [Cellvibrionaceae bacterium]|nr:FAD-dependent oxidoreductase [Cellvibrionaceae bacterium]